MTPTGPGLYELEFRPRLRWPLDVQRTTYSGEEYLVIIDREGFAVEPAVFPVGLGPVLGSLDGTATLRELIGRFAPHGASEEFMQSLVYQLDQGLFLDSDRFRHVERETFSHYLSSPVRPEALAGKVYPAEEKALVLALERYLRESHVRGLGGTAGNELGALICPHIDYRRGWQSYAATFNCLREFERPDVVFLFGTSHQASRGLFHLTRKNFSTPLGVFSTAADLVDTIAQHYGEGRSFGEELLHRTEHSLELQLPFLAHWIGTDSGVKLVPILVGSFYPFTRRATAPDHSVEFQDFVGGTVEAVKASINRGQKVLLFGGVDLAHVGLHFGDERPVALGGLGDIERRDREFLDLALSGDRQRLAEHIAEDGDARRICGYPSIYTMLAVFEALSVPIEGKLVEYRQAVDAITDCIVTFASALWFYRSRCEWGMAPLRNSAE